MENQPAATRLTLQASLNSVRCPLRHTNEPTMPVCSEGPAATALPPGSALTNYERASTVKVAMSVTTWTKRLSDIIIFRILHHN